MGRRLNKVQVLREDLQAQQEYFDELASRTREKQRLDEEINALNSKREDIQRQISQGKQALRLQDEHMHLRIVELNGVVDAIKEKNTKLNALGRKVEGKEAELDIISKRIAKKEEKYRSEKEKMAKVVDSYVEKTDEYMERLKQIRKERSNQLLQIHEVREKEKEVVIREYNVKEAEERYEKIENENKLLKKQVSNLGQDITILKTRQNGKKGKGVNK